MLNKQSQSSLNIAEKHIHVGFCFNVEHAPYQALDACIVQQTHAAPEALVKFLLNLRITDRRLQTARPIAYVSDDFTLRFCLHAQHDRAARAVLRRIDMNFDFAHMPVDLGIACGILLDFQPIPACAAPVNAQCCNAH